MKPRPQPPGINRAAHWTKVVSSIASGYGVSFGDAKFIYDRLKETTGRTPSLRMVAALPNQLPDTLWIAPAAPPAVPPAAPAPKPRPAPAAAPKPARKAARKAARKGYLDLPKGISLPPPLVPPPLGKPKKASKFDLVRPVKNTFEAVLKDGGLPVGAIARNKVGKMISKLSTPDQKAIAKALVSSYKQIQKKGFVSRKNVEKVKKLVLKKLGKTLGELPWNFLFKSLYGKGRRQAPLSSRPTML